MSDRQEQLGAVSDMPRNRRRVSWAVVERMLKMGLDLGLANPTVQYGADGSVNVQWSNHITPLKKRNEWDR